MAYRPSGYGMTADCEKKKGEKYDRNLERQAQQWIEAVTGERIGPNFADGLKSGVVLCKLINKIRPGSVKKINNNKLAFSMMENIGNFLEACYAIGMNKMDLFQTVDLYEAQNIPQVISGIHALGRKAQSIGFRGPRLGVKESHGETRYFSEDQKKAGQSVIGLQMGYAGGANQSGQNFGLGRQIHHQPKYGVKESHGETRYSSEDQKKAGQSFIGLQMGYAGGANQSGQNFGLGRQIHHNPKYK